MEKKVANGKVEQLFKKSFLLDDVCSYIYVILLGKGKHRFNDLYRVLDKLGIKMSKPTFSEHMKHLTKQRLVRRKKEDRQNVTYMLNEELSQYEKSQNLRRWIEHLEGREKFDVEKYAKQGLPPPPQWKVLTPSESLTQTSIYYKKYTAEDLKHEIDKDLHEAVLTNLYELRTIIEYELHTGRETDANFWKFIGNPLYRLFEKAVAENCRASLEYREKFIEQLNALIKKYERET